MSQHELTLDPTSPLAAGLAGALADMLGFIRAQVVLAPTDPAPAVHDYRRSIRRARAQLALTAPFLPPRVFAWVDGSLRRAFRETSELRDHGVLIPTLELVAPAISDPKATEGIRALLTAAREHVEAGHAADVLARRGRWLAGTAELYGEMIDPEVDADALRAALAASYAFTRRAFRRVYATRREVDLHSWRKAVKELRYQLELLVNGGFGDLVTARVGAAEQTRLLGDVTDVMALVGFVRSARAELVGVSVKTLRRELDRVIAGRIEELLALGAPFYALRPKAFGRAPSDAEVAAGVALEHARADSNDEPRPEPAQADAVPVAAEASEPEATPKVGRGRGSRRKGEGSGAVSQIGPSELFPASGDKGAEGEPEA